MSDMREKERHSPPPRMILESIFDEVAQLQVDFGLHTRKGLTKHWFQAGSYRSADSGPTPTSSQCHQEKGSPVDLREVSFRTAGLGESGLHAVSQI